MAGFVQALDGRQGLPAEPQVAVGVVLQDQNVILHRQLIDPAAFFHRHGDAGGILEVGNGVEEPDGSAFPECCLQGVHIDAVLLHGNSTETGAGCTEGIQTAQEGGFFAENDVAGVAEDPGSEIAALLGTGDDDTVIKLPAAAIPGLHPAGHRPAQGRISLGDTVLKRLQGLLSQNAAGDVLHGGNGIGLRCRVARSQ